MQGLNVNLIIFFLDIMIFTLFHYYYWNNFDEKPYTADLATVKMKLEIGATIREIPA